MENCLASYVEMIVSNGWLQVSAMLIIASSEFPNVYTLSTETSTIPSTRPMQTHQGA
jgi:hypothetical protein